MKKRRHLAALALLASLVWGCGFAPAAWHSVLQVVISGGGGGCAEATTANARLDGGQNTSALTTMICGMVTDGTYSGLDALYVTTINSIGNAQKNLATPSSFNLALGVAGAFTANAGLAGDGTTVFYDTGFDPSTAGGNFSQNSASVGVCLLNSSTSGGSIAVMGAVSTPFNNYTYLSPNNPAGTLVFDINDGAFPTAVQGSTNLQGSWIISRTTSTLVTAYQNGASIGTSAAASAAVANVNIYLFAYNNGGAAAQFSAATVGYAFIGLGFTGAQVSNLYSRLHTYVQAVNPGAGC